MRLTTILRASPVLLGLAIAASAGCGGSVVSGTGGGGTGGTSTSTGTGGTSTSTGTGGTGTGGAGGYAACDGPGQCVIVNPGCCDPCGEQNLTNKTAVNAAHLDAYQQAVCPVPDNCPKCATIPNPNLFAYCDNGTCRVADASTHAVSACSADADCTLRYGTACCEGCSGDVYGLIAVSVNGNLGQLVCADGQSCPACAPIYPPEAAAICSGGHCAVVLSDPGG